MATDSLIARALRGAGLLGVLALGVLFASTASAQDKSSAEGQEVLRRSAADRPNWENPIDEIDMGVILDRARGLYFDDVKWVTDTQPLVFRVVDELRVGPLASIRPRAGTHLMRSAEYDDVWSRGLFAAAVDVEVALPMIGLETGKNYIWVDGPDEENLRAYIVPDQPRGDRMMVSVCSVRSMQHLTDSGLAHAYFAYREPAIFGPAFTIHFECKWGCCDIYRCTQRVHRGTLER